MAKRKKKGGPRRPRRKFSVLAHGIPLAVLGGRTYDAYKKAGDKFWDAENRGAIPMSIEVLTGWSMANSEFRNLGWTAMFWGSAFVGSAVGSALRKRKADPFGGIPILSDYIKA